MQAVGIFNQSDSPWNFKTLNRVGGIWEIEYKNLIEINQGAPPVGNLCVNGVSLPNSSLFGSPFIYTYIPMFIRRFCLSGFILSRVDLITAKMSTIGKIKKT